MSKENLRKHTSIKTTLPGLSLQRRQSTQNIYQHTISDPKISCTTEQTQVMKKIQNKLRMRKRSTNINHNQKLVNTPPEQMDALSSSSLSNHQGGQSNIGKRLQSYDVTVNINQILQKMLRNNQDLIDKISLARVDREAIKQQLNKDATFILCQLNKGRKIQQIVQERITNIIFNNKLKQKIQQKEKSILAMMDERIRKLMILQKPLVH